MGWTDWLPAFRGDLRQLEAKLDANITALKTKFDADIAAINANLANISGDIDNLNAQIKALNDKLAAGVTLSDEDKAALQAIADGADALSTSTKALADRTPDAPTT